MLTGFVERLGGLLGILLLASVWELAPRIGLINRDFFPPLIIVLSKLLEMIARVLGLLSQHITHLVLGVGHCLCVRCNCGLVHWFDAWCPKVHPLND